MIFAWSDTRYGGRDVYAQKVDQFGNQLWGSEGVPIVLAPGRQEDLGSGRLRKLEPSVWGCVAFRSIR